MYGLRLSLFFAISALLMLNACKVRSKTLSQPGLEKGSQLNEKEQLNFSYLYFDGLKDKILGNIPQAQSKFQNAIRIDPRNDAAHYELSQIYALTDKNDLAKVNGELAVKFNPGNIWYKRSLAEIYEQLGERNKQIALLHEIVNQRPDEPDALYDLADAYILDRKYEEALKVYEKIEKREGLTEEVAVRKKNIYLRLGKPAKAIDEINNLIRQNPDEVSYYGVLAEIYLYDNKPDKAFEQYQEILRRDPQNANVHFSLADYYRRKGDNTKSFEELRLAFSNPDGDISLKLQVISSYFEITASYPELKPQAYNLCEDLIKMHPGDARVYAIYGDFLFRDERYKEAEAQYYKAIRIDKSRFSTWNQLLLTLNELAETQKLNELSAEAAGLFPQQAIFFLYQGLSAMQLKQYQQAVDPLKEGLMLTVDNRMLTIQFLSSLGDVYHHLNQGDKSDESYEKALKLDPDNTYVLNNYAYYLSLRKSKLEHAIAMAKKCNEIAPGRPSYEDTLAWVLFQSGKNEEALVWIEKAVRSGGGTSSTIVEHLGDINWSLNKKDAAIESWNKALNLGGEIDRLQKKIREGLPSKP